MDILLFFIAGGVLLVAGAELLVRGASRIAVAAGVTPLVVGLTVVAFGTSSPELAVTIGSVRAGQADIAVGNVVGSNIFNILFILGLSALVTPLIVAQQLVRIDVPLMIGASALVLVFALDGVVGRGQGLLLFLGLLAYTGFLIRQSRREVGAVQDEYEGAFGGEERRRSRWWINVGLVIVGLGMLVIGADWLVDAATRTAATLGVSQLVIGLTIVAAGTSLPEVATSVIASVRGERDIAVGNVIGSNLFNLLGVLGLGAALSPDGVPVSQGALTFDLPVMIGVAVAALPVLFTGHLIGRREGAMFLGFYVAYTVYLILDSSQHHALEEFRAAMGFFVLPLTALTLIVMVVRARLRTKAS